MYNTVDTSYKTHGYMVQSLNRLKTVWNGIPYTDVFKYIIKN